MNHLKQHPDLSIAQVANKTGVSVEQLREEQLKMLRNHLKRDSYLWSVDGYGR